MRTLILLTAVLARFAGSYLTSSHRPRPVSISHFSSCLGACSAHAFVIVPTPTSPAGITVRNQDITMFGGRGSAAPKKKKAPKRKPSNKKSADTGESIFVHVGDSLSKESGYDCFLNRQ